MDDRFDFPGWAIFVQAIMHALYARQWLAAFWATLRHDERFFRARPLFKQRTHDFRNDIGRFAQNNRIANHKAFVFDEVFIVERSALD